MTQFNPKPGEYCLLNGAKVLYVGLTGVGWHVFENEKGMIEKFSSFDLFRPINKEYEQIFEMCMKDVQVTNTTSMAEALKKLYDAGMLKLPSESTEYD